MRSFGTEISGNRGCGCELSNIQRAYAIGQHEAGKPTSEIAATIHCDPRTIRKIIQRQQDHNTIDSLTRSGVPKKLTYHVEHRIVTIARRKPKFTYAQLKLEADTDVSHSTLKRIPHKHHITNWRARKLPHLTEQHVKLRLAFARKYRSWTIQEWRNVIFSDECSVKRGTGKQRT